MSPDASDIADLIRRRKFTVVPQDQQKLLDRTEAWAVDLKDTTHGLAHVPGHVLTLAKEAYIASQLAQSRRTTRPSANTTPAKFSPRRTRSSQPPLRSSPVEPEPATPEALQTQVRQTSPDGSIPWTPSPPRPAPRRTSAASTNGPKTPKDVTMAPPRRSTPPRRAAPVFEFQSSDNEEDMLTQNGAVTGQPRLPLARGPSTPVVRGSPTARGSQTAPTVRSSAITVATPISQIEQVETPPCAQPRVIVPGTVLKEKPVAQSAGPRPYRRMKPITFSDDSPEPEKLQITPKKTRITKGIQSIVSSSMVPATIPGTATQATVEESSSGQSNSGTTSRGNGIDTPPIQAAPVQAIIPSSAIQQTQESEAQSPGKVTEHALPVIQQSQHSEAQSPEKVIDLTSSPVRGVAQGNEAQSTEKTIHHTQSTDQHIQEGEAQPSEKVAERANIISAATSQKRNSQKRNMMPFEAFVAIYPQYVTQHSGNLKDFVKSCICLEFLRKTRSLKDDLYDDFIRSFPQYIRYVRAAGPGQEPLPAIEWYVDVAGAAIFFDKAVTKQNLEAVLNSYPELVAQAKGYISGRSADDDKSTVLPETSTVGHDSTVEMVEPADVRPHTPRVTESERPQQVVSRVARQTSPQLGSSVALPPMPPPSSASSILTTRSSTSRPSDYLERLSRRVASKRRADDDNDRLREHIRRKLANGKATPSSSRAESS